MVQSARPGRQRGHNKVTSELAALMDRGGAHPTASGARLYQGGEQASARRRLSPSMLQEQVVSLGNQGTLTMLQLLHEPAAWRGLGGRGAWLMRGLHEHSHIYIYLFISEPINSATLSHGPQTFPFGFPKLFSRCTPQAAVAQRVRTQEHQLQVHCPLERGWFS